MDPVAVALMRIKHEVPRDVLEQAFLPSRYDPTRHERYSDKVHSGNLDFLIRTQVVDARVSIDVNLLTGTELYLPLALATREAVDPWNTIYRFDSIATGGRHIVTAHEVLYGLAQGIQSGSFGSFDTRSSQYLHIAKDILKAGGGTSPAGTAYVQLVAPNTVLVNDITQISGPGVLRCKLCHDLNFSDILPVYYHAFGELIVLATKAYIYNQLVIEIDESQLRGGMTIGRFREVVDQYADAGRMYMEYLTTRWQKIGTMNDTEQYRKIMKMNLGAKPKY